jgi:hypothetical protein
MHDFDPRGQAAAGATLGLLIGKSGEPAQVPPIGTGAISAVERGQLLADGGSDRGRQGSATDVHPSLPMAGAGLEHYTRLMPVGAHVRENGRFCMVQINQDITCVVALGIRLNVDIAAFPITGAQEADGGQMLQLVSGPQSLPRDWSFGGVMNQTNEI